ncbi:MAG: hypothetical protein KBA40_03350 [Candidatus Peribacteraceae bacterium]|nr:hypothetical protein [Candidatus Peribacteraceae bacterium]
MQFKASTASLSKHLVIGSLAVLALVIASVTTASAQSSWSPTLLVNTESFQTIDDGDGTTDIELRFGNTSNTIKFLNATGLFRFSAGISVLGTISGSKLAIDGNATISGSLLVKNNIAAKGTISGSTINGFGLGSCNGASQKLIFNSGTGKFECGTDLNTATSPWSNTGSLQTAFDSRYVNQSGDTMTGALNVRANLSGSSLRVSGPADIHGALTASGAFRTDSNITINDDADANDAVLTFGNASGNETIKFLNSSQKFEFSNSIRVLGNISGSTLTIDGAITLHGVTYSAPSAQGSANTVLKNDGAGNLTWSSTIGNSSGGVLSLHPEYQNAIYFSSGSTYIGQMTMSGGTTALENSYVWTSTRGTLQDYWISVRVRIPDNFSSWDPVKPIELRYKTGVASAASNHVSVRIKDTTGTERALTSGGGLSNTSWTTALITGPQSGGTWTPKGYITIYVKLAANSTANANAAAGFINLNYETTTP